MSAESYTPGHSQNATDFRSIRSVRSHGQFFMPHLTSGVSVLDCGCGPGSITLGIAALVAPGKVVGGDVQVGRKIGEHLKASRFKGIEMSARYECYPSLPRIGEYLALQLEKQNDLRSAATLREWSHVEGGMFAQCWVSCIAYKH